MGIEIALKHISEYETLVNRSLYFFTDCQSAISSAFGSNMARYKVNIILNIRRLVAQLKDSGDILSIHWISGRRGFQGNELVDSLAKEAAKSLEGQSQSFTREKPIRKKLQS